jgi:hypothetical protein
MCLFWSSDNQDYFLSQQQRLWLSKHNGCYLWPAFTGQANALFLPARACCVPRILESTCSLASVLQWRSCNEYGPMACTISGPVFCSFHSWGAPKPAIYYKKLHTHADLDASIHVLTAVVHKREFKSVAANCVRRAQLCLDVRGEQF